MRWLLVNSGYRVGSTLVYSLVRAATRASIGLVEPWVVDRIDRCHPLEDTAVKVHQWTGTPERAVSILPIRDPRDVLASLIRFPETRDEPWKYLTDTWGHFDAMRSRSIVFRYEDYWSGSPLAFTASFFEELGLPIKHAARAVMAGDPGVAHEKSHNLMPYGYDPETELRYRHVSDSFGIPGAWRKYLDDEKLQRIEREVSEWLGMYQKEERAA